MKLIYIAGEERTGITSLIVSVLKMDKLKNVGVIAHNMQSAMVIEEYCDAIDSYPIKPCCARPRMLEFRMEKMLENKKLDFVITEPPGMSGETAAPLLNRLYALGKNKDIAPLTTVVDGDYILTGSIDRNNLRGLSVYNQIFESDCVAIHQSDRFDEKERKIIETRVREINPDCEIVFTSSVTDENIDRFADLILTKSYRRPLVN